MNIERNIFGFRHPSNVFLYPSPEELAAFVASPARTPGSDLAAYRTLIDEVRGSELLSPLERIEQDLGQKVFTGVLSHTRFASPALAAEFEHYQYLLHVLKAADLRKPATFIRAADEEMAKLDPRNKAQADRLHRLRTLSDARRRELQALQRRREALCAELVNIARYVRDNLVKIERVCRTALVVLSDVRLAGQIEQRLMEDVKEHFRHDLKETRDRRTLTPSYLERLKRDVEMLAKEIATFRRETAAAIETLYQATIRHAGDNARAIDSLLAKLGERRCEGDATDQALFGRIEQQLVTVVSGYRFEFSLRDRTTTTPYADVFNSKKRDALASLFDLVRGERRALANRRRGRDRRMFDLPSPKTLERRGGKERRSGRDRRTEASAHF